ncbi:MAG: large-conductance mechanosensitive channel protein MscL [Spirochaetes bacterium]|uniref:Large-conductance mechanosensitive channel n=1 Tax=Candidatus Ornithospirochaeta stercoripullorum TaxID=2840899 RepID=A0A9D9DY15_9SPIO|nr:large-conductance mechanosensitive channel protein MscL [Candidatus Ornithospirochaeta stercoripullorum]
MKDKGFFAEFKKFISRGNVLDMAVGIAAGAAFTAIINSFVNDIINPIIGLLIGGVDFSELQIVLKPATETTAEVAIRYGMFINAIISFIIISFALFLMIKAFNKLADATKKKNEEAKKAPAAPPADIQLLTEIRDLLKKN